MSRYTIVPSSLFDGSDAHSLLSELVTLTADDKVKYIELPEYEAVLVYCNNLPKVYYLISALGSINVHNKVLTEIVDGELHLVLAAANRLLLVNTYKVMDFTTAVYFIFAALKEFQINPEMTTIFHRGEFSYEQKELLFKYFLGVEAI